MARHRSILRVAALGGLGLLLAAATPSPSKVFPYPLTSETLENGLKVVFVRMPTPGLVAYYTLVRVGSRNEVEPGHSGFAHLFEHMMFRGTKKYPAEAWETRLKARGVDSTAFTWNDQTVYTFIAPTEALPTIVEMEADRFQNLTYTKQVFQTETKAVLGEYHKNYANPTEKMEEVLLDQAFSRHTYKHSTMGFLADIRKMPARFEYGLRFFQRFYRPDNCVVFVVGDFDRSRVLALVRKHYGSWQGKAEEQRLPEEPPQRKERRRHVAWETDTQARLMVGYHTPSLGTDLKAAAAQNVLGPYHFGENSPLYRELVLDRQLVESMHSQYVDTRDPRLFYFLVTLSTEGHLAAVEKRIAKAVAEVASGKLDARRLADVQSNLRYGLLMGLEAPATVAETLALAATPTGDPGALDALYDQIARLRPEELAAFARRYLVPENRTVVTLTGAARKSRP